MASEKRLIDANVFADHLERMARTTYPNLLPGLLEAAEFARDFLPAVDGVEVVRCKDCKHWCYGYDCVGLCTVDVPDIDGVQREDFDFCSYGERKTDG